MTKKEVVIVAALWALIIAIVLGWSWTAQAQVAQWWNGYGTWRTQSGVYTDNPCLLVANYDGSDGWCLRELEPRVSAVEADNVNQGLGIAANTVELGALDDAIDVQTVRLMAAEDEILKLHARPVVAAIYDATDAYTGARMLSMTGDDAASTAFVTVNGVGYRLTGFHPTQIQNDAVSSFPPSIGTLYFESIDCTGQPLFVAEPENIAPIADRSPWFSYWGPANETPVNRQVFSTYQTTNIGPADEFLPQSCGPAFGLTGDFVSAIVVWRRSDWTLPLRAR